MTLVERDEELASLTAALAALPAGSGRVVLVQAPAGVGKTALLDAVADVAARTGSVLRARGSELERSFSYGLLGQLLGPALRAADPERRSRLLAGAAAAASAIVLGDPSEVIPALADPARLHHQLHSLYWLCANHGQPLVLLVDDAQWADEASLRFLAYLGGRTQDLPALMVVAVRPPAGPPEPWLAELQHSSRCLRLELRSLSQDGVGAMLMRHLGGTAPAVAVAVAATRSTGGNPFLVEELARDLRRSPPCDHAGLAARIARSSPAAVQDSVAVRLLQQGTAAQALAFALAVLGDGGGVDDADVGGLAGLDRATADAAAGRLRDAGLAAPGRPLAFAHPILRNACYDRIPLPERDRLHRCAAERLAASGRPAEQVAAHLLVLPPANDPWVCERLVEAARRAEVRGAAKAGLTYLQRALDEPAPAALADDLQQLLSVAELELGLPGAVQRLMRWLEGAADTERVGRLVLEAAPVLALQGRPSEALDLIDRTMAAGAAQGPLAPLLELERSSLLKMSSGQALVTAWPLPPPPPVARGIADRLLLAERALRLTLSCTDAAGSVRAARAAIAQGWPQRTMLDLTGFGQAVWALIAGSELTEAAVALRTALDTARGHGRLWILMPLYNWRTLVDTRAGDLIAAERAGFTALALLGGAPSPARAGAIAHLLDPLIELGRIDEADELLTGHGLTGDLPPGLLYDFVLDARMGLRLAQRRFADVLADGELLDGRAAGGLGANPGLCAYRLRLALAHHHLGDRRAAVRLARDEAIRAAGFGAPIAIGMTQRCEGTITGGPDGLALLRSAVGRLHGTAARHEYDRACVELGAALRRSGQRAEARELLRAAHARATQRGARQLSTQARQEFALSGGRGLAATHPAGLTGAEQRVCQAAREGLSNRQIAQELFLSLKTVEMHLTRSYRKLGVASRHGLPAVPATPGHL